MSRKLFQASILTLAMASPDAFALGLGGLRTQSALNQPFFGEIEVIDIGPDEIDTLRVMLASPEDFADAGVERYHFLTRLRFSAEATADGRVVVRVSSQDPIREPYLDFLVAAVWPQGRLLKSYTVLLDPPLTTANRPAPIQPALAASGAASASAGAGASPRSPAFAVQAGDGFPLTFGPVPQGTGVWRLARTKTPPGATVAQTALALYRNNQPAFIRGDINRLLAGKTLVIPSRAELFALSAAEAEREFKAALRGESVHRAPLAPLSATGPAAGEDQPRLRLAGESARPIPPGMPPASGAPQAAIEQDLLLVMEASESTRQETSELRGRILELEKQLSGIQELLDLRNAELAELRGGEPTAAPAGIASEAAAVAGTPSVETPEAELSDDLALPATVGVLDESATPEQPQSSVDAAAPGTPPTGEAGLEDGPDALADAASDRLADDSSDLPQELLTPPLTDLALPELEGEAGLEPALDEAAGEADLAAEVGVPDEVPVTEPLPDTEASAESTPDSAVAPPLSAPPVETAPALAPKTESPPDAQPQSQTPPAAVPAAQAPTGAEDQNSASLWYALLLPVAGLAGLVALGIGGFAWWSSRRRKPDETEEGEPSLEELDEFEPLDVQSDTRPRTPETAPREAEPEESLEDLGVTRAELSEPVRLDSEPEGARDRAARG